MFKKFKKKQRKNNRKIELLLRDKKQKNKRNIPENLKKIKRKNLFI